MADSELLYRTSWRPWGFSSNGKIISLVMQKDLEDFVVLEPCRASLCNNVLHHRGQEGGVLAQRCSHDLFNSEASCAGKTPALTRL